LKTVYRNFVSSFMLSRMLLALHWRHWCLQGIIATPDHRKLAMFAMESSQ